MCLCAWMRVCVSFCVCVSQKVCPRIRERCIFMIACVFSCVPLIIHRCCKKHTIIVVSSLFFSFHKDLSTARGALRLLLGSQILLFLFSLPATPPHPTPPSSLLSVFSLKRTLTGVCSELFIFHYLALSCLLTQG